MRPGREGPYSLGAVKHAWPVVAVLVAITLFTLWVVTEWPTEDRASPPPEPVAADAPNAGRRGTLETPEDVGRTEVIEGTATVPDSSPTQDPNAASLGRVAGTVSDASGRPVAGALVRVGRGVWQ